MSTRDSSLQDRAIKLKGKEYVLVKDRILYFNENYKNGSIETEVVKYPFDNDPLVIVRARVYPSGIKLDEIGRPVGQVYTGHSQAIVGGQGANKEAAVENAETSAIGRALALMGIGVIDSIASVDEMRKAGIVEGWGND